MPKTFLSDDALDHEVLYQLMQHIGQQNAIERRTLMERVYGLGLTVPADLDANIFDRQVRRSIERLRHQGHLIANMGNGDGYYVISKLEEYQAFRAMYVSHAVPIMEAARQMDREAERKWPNPAQPRML